MSYEGDILDEEIIGTHSNWDNENSIIGNNIFILTQDTDVVKRGNSINTFIELPAIIDINDLNDINDIYLDYIDLTLSSDISDRIAVFNSNLKIDRTDVMEKDLDLQLIDGKFIEINSVLAPIINGPIRKTYGTSFSLKADSFTSYREKGGYIETYEWILPDESVQVGKEITIDIADDPGLIGTALLYSCKAIDILGNQSALSYFTVTIADSDYPVVTPSWIILEVNPSIFDLIWSNDSHIEMNTYDLTIIASDPNNQNLTYQLACDDANVTITQDGVDETIFHVSYPEYDEDTTVTFIATVINEDLYFDTSNSIKVVANISANPIISNLLWSAFNHKEATTYELTIVASDPNNQDLTYDVVCDDGNVTIVQDGVDDNIFHVTYPDYDEDTTVNYTITVTNEDLLTDVESSIKIVSDVNPEIDSLDWNDDDHEEQETYDLTIIAIDPQGQDLTYEVECDDVNVTIVQDGIDDNIFHVTYPDYSSDTTVNYTITVTNEDLRTDVEVDSKLVSIVATGGDRGIFGGGTTNSGLSNIIDYITISTPGNAIDFGDLSTFKQSLSSTSNGINNTGIFGGGTTGSDLNTIDYINISTSGDAVDFGDLTIARYGLASTSNGINNRGVFGGGYSFLSDNTFDTIDYITISTPGDAVDFGDLTVAKRYLSSTSNGINDRGIFGGGSTTIYVNIIDYITISTPGNAADFGDLTVSRSSLAATSNGINNTGIFAGGLAESKRDTIDYINISTPGDAVDFGDLTVATQTLSSTSNGINNTGIFAGGFSTSNSNVIEYINISTPGDAVDFGDLTVSRSSLAACSDG